MCEVWGQMKYDPTHISNILIERCKKLITGVRFEPRWPDEVNCEQYQNDIILQSNIFRNRAGNLKNIHISRLSTSAILISDKLFYWCPYQHLFLLQMSLSFDFCYDLDLWAQGQALRAIFVVICFSTILSKV